MAINEISDWLWEVVGGGVVGNAAYDGIKRLLGNSFAVLKKFSENNQYGSFNESIKDIKNNNPVLFKELKSYYSNNSDKVLLKNVSAGGDIIIGSGNKNN